MSREIKKPEKKNNPEGLDRPIDFGYDQACDDWEKYLNTLKPKIDEGKLEKFIFTFLFTKKLSETYRNKCRCIDGCVTCEGTGYRLNELGVALIDLAHTLTQRQEEWLKTGGAE